MRNQDVIEMFVDGSTSGRTKNLKIQGNLLINYSTVIAKRLENGNFAVDGKKYSSTTSTIQNKLKNTLDRQRKLYSVFNTGIETEPEDHTYKIIRMHADSLYNYIVKRGLTREEAQEWCSREDTNGDGWFDGFEKED